jgi:hypothetical protein
LQPKIFKTKEIETIPIKEIVIDVPFMIAVVSLVFIFYLSAPNCFSKKSANGLKPTLFLQHP